LILFSVLQFEISGDEITKFVVSGPAAVGPSSCQDLRMIGHSLDGFYTIRSNATVMKTIYCDFYGKIGNKMNPTTTMPSTSTLTSTLKAGIFNKQIFIKYWFKFRHSSEIILFMQVVISK